MNADEVKDILNTQLFPGKTVSDIFKEIHTRATEKELAINSTIDVISSKISDASSAVSIGMFLSQYFTNAIDNDEQLIKLIATFQKFVAGTKNNVDSTVVNNFGGMSEKEKADLINQYKDFVDKDKDIEDKIEILSKNVPRP